MNVITSARKNIMADSFNGKYEQVRLGDRIKLNSGVGSRFGQVYAKCQDRWGRYLRVKLDDFTFETVHGFTEVGIGAYYLGRNEMLSLKLSLIRENSNV